MAENENGQEKTEEPTQKKLDKAKEDGQVPRSKELNTTLLLMGSALGLLFFGGRMAESMLEVMRFNFDINGDTIHDEALMMGQLYKSLIDAGLSVVPVFAILGIVSFIGPISLSGFNLSAKALKPKFNRLNPASGIKRIFSMNSLVELIKAIAKFSLVSAIAIIILLTLEGRLMSLSQLNIGAAIQESLNIILWSCLGISAATIIIAMADVPYQLFDNKKKLKMTLQEIKDEMKETEGKPEVKGRIRQLQREMSQKRMMESVPDADVVITNPEHFSVALKYDTEGGGAPIVLAKGVDHTAFKIREIAEANDVELLASPQLARAIYFTTEIDHEIPENLYLAVAQVLAYVFQLKTHRKGKGPKPKPLGKMPIPKDAQYGADGKVS